VLRKRPKIMREKPCRIISLFGIVQFLYERKGCTKFPFCPVYSGRSLWVSDNNGSSDRTQGRPPSFPLCDCIFTNLMVWIKYGQSSEIFLSRIYFIYTYIYIHYYIRFPLTWPIHISQTPRYNIYLFFRLAVFVFVVFENRREQLTAPSVRTEEANCYFKN